MSLDHVDVFITDSSEVPALRKAVARYELRTAVSELPELWLELHLRDPELDLASLVGHQVLVTFGDEPSFAQFDGIVRRSRQISSEPTGLSRYEIGVAPHLWLTSLRTEHRIFQDRSVPEIVADVLAGYSDRIPPPDLRLSGAHPKREYCVQYGETDLDFVFRLLAEEGISSFFEVEELGRSPALRWVLVDDTTLGGASVSVPFVPPSGERAAGHHVLAVEVTAEMRASSTTVRDYDYHKPAFLLEREARAAAPLFAGEEGLEAYTFEVGKFSDERDGDARARQFLEEARATRRVLRCCPTFALPAGARLGVSGLPGHAMEDLLLVVRSRTTGARGARTGDPDVLVHVLECVPASSPFRPRRRPKPRIHGTHSAIVVGEKAGVDEIDVDELGRVKVEFRWDRRDLHQGKPTRRLRVSQGWAGHAFGIVLLPRVNEEVIVAYLDGDPDEPIIIGRVHNAVVQTPLKLPDDKTQSIWRSRSSPGGDGFNQILMEDRAGQERLEMRAQRDFRHDTLHDSTTTVGNDQSVTVTGSQSFSAGSHSTSAGTISFDARTTLDAHAGSNMSLAAGNVMKEEAPVVVIEGASVTGVGGGAMLVLHAKATASLSGPSIVINGGDVTVRGDQITIGNGSSVTIKGATVNVDGGTVNIKGGTVNVSGGAINLNS